MAAHPAGEPLGLFAYGSLIWNPAFNFRHRELARVYGYHRRFCLWTHLGRGTRERPGLMLGLDQGGSCRGVLYGSRRKISRASSRSSGAGRW